MNRAIDSGSTDNNITISDHFVEVNKMVKI